ncbi:hypothetical protein [Campylobacter gastrosuis]|uniref:C4-dicarboxylate ABC transporter substrate-binding protein n=1 Tax=Campylobacter gastrosuis TaxID=2974576 RepID=A0ABT7HPM1_9BACT|nr:hypothetical protein [Campylobacter gastrosuis]MDL0088765.1 hypothetical protein [Campylobacter gastrosuis]
MRALKFLSIFILLNFSFANERQTTLLLHHFMSSKAPAHTKLIEPWARQVEAMSNGEIKIEILPSMSLGGKPNELYRQVRDQAVDLVWVLAAFAPGVFARTEIFELPTIYRGNSLDTTMAIYENFDLIKDDYKRVKPLLIHAFAGNALHSVNKRIEKMSDLKGLKLRSP